MKQHVIARSVATKQTGENNHKEYWINSVELRFGCFPLRLLSASLALAVRNDGQNGNDDDDRQNGVDGHSPQIGVAQDTDGEYYWTLDGEWIEDGNGSKMRVTGENGQNGITPQIRINAVSNEWEISYNSSENCTLTDIKDKGNKGDKGDAIFAANGVDNSNDDYVEFTLADGITKIQVPKYKELSITFT
ncbi:MAG: DUF4988 domain-containing protein [Prevotellaceae bacterium]|nr:DUF4988 domain-containing protein [Prevotellaceae bacterium]